MKALFHLVVSLLPQSAATLLGGANVGILGCVSPLQKPGSEPNTESALSVERLNDKHESAVSNTLHHLLIDHIERALVDKSYIVPLVSQSLHGVQGPVQSVTERNNVSDLAFADEVVLAAHEGVALSEEFRAVLLLNGGKL